MARLGAFGSQVGVRDGQFFCERLPAFVCRRLQQRLDVDRPQLVRELQHLGLRVLENFGAAMFLLAPGLALWLKAAYANRSGGGLRYTEHLVFALHVHTLWFLGFALTLPGWWWLSAAMSIVVPWYTFLAMQRVYGGRRLLRLLRGTGVALLYGSTLVATIVVMTLWALLV